MIRLHYEGDCNDAATGSQDTTLLCRGGQPVDNSTRRVLLDLVHTVTLSEKKKKKKKKKEKKKNPARLQILEDPLSLDGRMHGHCFMGGQVGSNPL